MATLNLSSNGPSINSSYQKIVNSPPPSGATASSPTYGQWAVFSVAAPLVSAFQQDGGKESVLKVQSTGEGELVDLVDEFSDGRIQFAFVKVKDPNTTLPKNVLIGWCGEGVPERTKGYFTSHLAAVSKVLHGYHVQVTARSDRDLTPEGIVQKVADASGAKYSGGPAVPTSGGGPPPIASKPKPAFTPTRIGGGGTGFNPLGSRARAPASQGDVDTDGWGADAPPVTRTQLEKVESAYKPTRVNMAELTAKKSEPSRFAPAQADNDPSDVVKGGYQPIGKVDIAAIRRQAKDSGSTQDDRPTPVKGAYEPVGKVDIAAIRAKAQAAPPAPISSDDADERPKSLAERSAAFAQPERLTTLPKPKVANKFGGSSTFTGTKAPAPGGFTSKPVTPAAPVGIASRTFADQGGKTPAQLWAEKKGRQGGATTAGLTSPLPAQKSGGWESGYTGKKWATVQTTHTGRSGASNDPAEQDEHEEAPSSPSGGVSAIRDRFKGAAPMGAPTERAAPAAPPSPPPLDNSSKPNAGVAMPGLLPRPVPPEPEEEEEEEEPELRPSSPIRVAMPVGRSAQPEPESDPEPEEPPVLPSQPIAAAVSAARAVPQPHEDDKPAPAAGGRRAIIQYDYEKAEENEIELREGEYVTNIDMVDEDWWMGTNSHGETGLFPSNYVELVDDDEPAGAAVPPPPPAAAHEPEPPVAAPAAGGSAGPTAIAQYDYEAAEENELSFPDGAKITGIEFPDEDWWFGHYGGKSGLFPANYVQLDD